MTASDRRIAVGLFLLAFIAYAWFFNGGGWNQNAQFDLARALVERRTLHIDGYRVNTGDVSWSPVSGTWHAYINKPPGVSFLAAIPYALIYAIEHARHIPLDSWKWMTINAYLVTLFTCGVTGALIPVVLFLYGGASPRSLAVALAIAFGTIVFPYSTMLYAHVPAALFLLLAFVWLEERPLLAGICAGLAGITFYICIPAALVLFIAARSRWRFALGGLPFAILLGLYHWLCFGSPLRTSVETSTNFTRKDLLFGVFGAPSFEALRGLTFSEYRGLFFVSPVLLLAIIGAFRMKRRELAIIAAIAAIFLVSIASFNGWEGGSAFGPRYLLPIIPLLGMAMLHVRGRVITILGILSFALQLLATSVDPQPSGGIRQPIREYLLRADATSINEQSIDELVPHSLYPHGSYESQWASFNLGERMFGAGKRASVVPVALWILLGSALLATYTFRTSLSNARAHAADGDDRS